MKDYIEERALEIAKYILSEGATVRQAATIFGVSKSTVHTVVPKVNANLITLLNLPWSLKCSTLGGFDPLLFPKNSSRVVNYL